MIVPSSKLSHLLVGRDERHRTMFFRIFKSVVKNVVEDGRCEVHQTVLGIREGREGWFEMFCLGGIACDDDGEMFSLMVKKANLRSSATLGSVRLVE